MSRGAKRSGDGWERTLDQHHQLMRRHGVAVFRCHPEVKVIRGVDGQVRQTVMVKAGPPDYIATVRGRAIVFDAKHTEADRWAYANLEQHQAEALDAQQAAGAICFLAIGYSGRGYVAPWPWLGPLWWAWWRGRGVAARGTACCPEAALAVHGQRFDPALAWLPYVLSLLNTLEKS